MLSNSNRSHLKFKPEWSLFIKKTLISWISVLFFLVKEFISLCCLYRGNLTYQVHKVCCIQLRHSKLILDYSWGLQIPRHLFRCCIVPQSVAGMCCHNLLLHRHAFPKQPPLKQKMDYRGRKWLIKFISC